MPSFQAIRDVPQAGIPPWEMEMFNQVKENLEILMGVRISGTRAITNDTLSVVQADNVTMKLSSARPSGYDIGAGVLVADFNQFVALLRNVNELASNVVSLQLQVNTLIGQLKS